MFFPCGFCFCSFVFSLVFAPFTYVYEGFPGRANDFEKISAIFLIKICRSGTAPGRNAAGVKRCSSPMRRTPWKTPGPRVFPLEKTAEHAIIWAGIMPPWGGAKPLRRSFSFFDFPVSPPSGFPLFPLFTPVLFRFPLFTFRFLIPREYIVRKAFL